jgi:hypothetical protein
LRLVTASAGEKSDLVSPIPHRFLRIAGYNSDISSESQMTQIAQTLSRVTGLEIEAESLGPVLIFCGIGLVVSLLALQAYGLDLSGGFF